MPSINNPQNVNLRELVNQNQNKVTNREQTEKPAEGKDFGATISDFIQAVNNDQKSADQAVADVAQGKSDNLHHAMASMEEARLSFQLMVEVRNKLLESYQTIQRMQV
jgi:flagellar hook-basal body complex protein FliE